MRARYWIIAGIIGAALLTLLLLRPRPSPGVPRGVPQAALDALRDGRYLRASQLIRAHLAGAQDTSAETILLLARAEAGWGDWARVEQLLKGRRWLDDVEGGLGRELLGRSLLALGDWGGAAREFRRYLDVAEGLTERDRGLALAREAKALQQQQKTAEALKAYDEAAEKLPPVRDWIGWVAAGAAADAGDTAEVRRRLAPLPPPLARDRGWRLRLRAALRARDTTAALAAAVTAAGTLPDATGRAAAWQTAGELRRRRGDLAGARAAYGAALTLAPGSAAAASSARGLLALSGLSADQRLQAAQALLRAGDAVSAAPALRAWLTTARVTPARRSALLLSLGSGLFDDGRYADAISTLRAGMRGAPAGSAARALYTIGRAQYRLGRAADARATLVRVTELYAGESAAASAFFLLGDLEHDAGNTARAAAWFRKATAVRGGGSAVGDAFMRLGQIQMATADYEGAVHTYETYRGRYPGGDNIEQATYWVARAYSRLGDGARARARLQELRRRGSLSWYALRAAQRLGVPLLPADGPRAAPAPSASARKQVAAGALRIDLLHLLELDEGAAEEARTLQAALARDEGALYDLAETLDARGLTSSGISIGLTLRRRAEAWNPRLLRIVYPFPYRDAIVAEARSHGLDPYLVAGLIRQESNFNASARSRAGAVGLMQVMPATGRTLARGLGVSRFDTEMLERPELNVQLGTRFVADLLKQTGGRVDQMLAAYNAGPARLERWRRFPEARDPELFAERVPYDETRHYVKVVQANARIYAALYPGLTGAPAGG